MSRGWLFRAIQTKMTVLVLLRPMSDKYPRRCPTSAAGFFFLIVIAPPSLRIGIDGGFKKIDSRHRSPSASSSFLFPDGGIGGAAGGLGRCLVSRPLFAVSMSGHSSTAGR